MFCPNCGTEIKEGSKFCSSCGASLEHFEKVADERGSSRVIEEFIELVKSTTKWDGRFDRRQYVTVFGGVFLISSVIYVGLFASVAVVEPGGFMESLLVVFFLAWYIVSIIVGTIIGVGAAVRRFHDLGLSGWCVLLLLIPLINFLTFLYLVFKSGKEVGETRWG